MICLACFCLSNLVTTATSPPFKIFLHDLQADSWLSGTIARRGILHGKEEENLIKAARNLIDKYESVKMLDIGANIGYMSLLLASQSAKVQVDAFEPLERHRNLFTRSVEENNLQNQIHIHSDIFSTCH